MLCFTSILAFTVGIGIGSGLSLVTNAMLFFVSPFFYW
jgi:hypothetical protein